MRSSMTDRALLFVALLAAGCGGEPPPVVSAPPPRAPELVCTEPQLAEGVALMDPTCAEGADEACDALDGDCDGHVDEGCEGARDAEVEVALAWNGRADVDLVLEAPGEPARVTSRGDCAEPADARLERAHLEALREGEYRVALQHTACGEGGPVTASVTVSVRGEVLGTFNRELAPGAESDVVRFGVTARER